MPTRSTLLACLLVHLGCSEVLVLPDDDGGEGGAPPVVGAIASASTATSWSASTGTGGVPPCDANPCALATGLSPSDIAIDETYVYVTSREDGAVRRVPKGGGALEVIASGDSPGSTLAVTADWVVWGAGSGVWRSAKSNADSVLLAAVPTGVGAVYTEGYSVFFSSLGPAGVIGSVPVEGGPVATLVEPAPHVPDLGFELHAKDWSRLYWVSQDGPGELRRLYLDGNSGPETVMSGLVGPQALLVAPEGIWIADREAGEVSRENGSGTGRSFLVSLDRPSGLAIDDELLYVTVAGRGAGAGSIIAIGRTSATGTLSIASGLTEPTAIAADETALYWIEAAPDRAVMRLTKE